MKTIFMKRADWEKWDAALRSGEYKQAIEALFDVHSGGYCCLGVLQQCLTGGTEADLLSDIDQLPSEDWLYKHGIEFLNGDAAPRRTPWLSKLDASADCANDQGVSFDRIAYAIEQAVEFTDENAA